MSGGGGSSKSTTVNYSPEESRRRSQIMDAALGIYQQQGDMSGQFPGARPVGFSPDTLQAQDMLRQVAQNNMQTVGRINQGLDYGLSTAMDVNNNPYFQGAVDAAIRPIDRAYTDPGGVFSNIRTGSIQAGGLGGSRQGIAEGIAGSRYLQQVGDVTSQMAMDAYNKGQDTFARTLAFAPQAMQAAATPATQLSAVGVQNEDFLQALEGYEAAGREWNINAPWMNLERAGNIVFGGGGSQSTTRTSAPPRNPLMGAVGGGMAGWALGASQGAQFGPWGAAAGALLGALM